jgi:hypothetical protein
MVVTAVPYATRSMGACRVVGDKASRRSTIRPRRGCEISERDSGTLPRRPAWINIKSRRPGDKIRGRKLMAFTSAADLPQDHVAL